MRQITVAWLCRSRALLGIEVDDVLAISEQIDCVGEERALAVYQLTTALPAHFKAIAPYSAVLLGMAAKSVRGVDQMPKLPDVSGYSFDELSRLVSLATKRMDEIRGKRIKELQAELGRLGADGDPAPQRGRTNGRSVEAAGRTARRGANGSGRKVAAQFRGPDGQEYSGRGAIPKWAKELGVDDRAGLEKYRIR